MPCTRCSRSPCSFTPSQGSHRHLILPFGCCFFIFSFPNTNYRKTQKRKFLERFKSFKCKPRNCLRPPKSTRALSVSTEDRLFCLIFTLLLSASAQFLQKPNRLSFIGITATQSTFRICAGHISNQRQAPTGEMLERMW